MTDTTTGTSPVSEMTFDGLRIRFDERVLTPRAWTRLQSQWAAELLPGLPEGPVLELCSGAGQIGLAAVRRSGRRLVCVDRDPAAVEYAILNARDAGMLQRVEVRRAPLTAALAPDEQFPLVIADPPWVRRAEVGSYPQDPLGAIDGGADGLAVARACLQVAAGHLARDGLVLLQLGSVEQADSLRPLASDLGLDLREVRVGERGVVVLFAPRA
jgi:ribosomal protein L3 glutamine methyltransferase